MALSAANIKIPFSSQSFIQGIIAVCVLIVLLCGWVMLRADDTNRMLQDKIPSTVTIIEKSSTQKISEPLDTPKAAMFTIRENLLENIDGMTVPKADLQSGATPFMAYRKHHGALPNTPLVSVVLTDAGLSKSLTEKALKTLPDTVTYSFSPYAETLNMQTDIANQAHIESWLQLALENASYPNPDPGPLAIFLNASLEEKTIRLMETLSTFQGYAGVITPPDHIFHRADGRSSVLLKQIFGRGLGLVEAQTGRPFFGTRLAIEKKYPFGQTSFYIAANTPPQDIRTKLRQAELKAMSAGKAIIMMPLTPLAVVEINDWADQLAGKTVQLAPLSATLQNNK